MKTQKIKLGDLVFDERLIKLRPINIFFVSQYRQAYRGGHIFPPIIVEENTNRIASGNHRATAMIGEYGLDYEVKVIVKKYASKKALLEDFVKENIRHGCPIDGITKKRLSIALINEGASLEELAVLFGVPVKRIIQMGEQTVVVIGVNGKHEILPVKKNFDTLAELTKSQYDEHCKRDLGIPPAHLAEQLLRWFRNDWIGRTDEHLAIMGELHEAIGRFLVEDVKVAQG